MTEEEKNKNTENSANNESEGSVKKQSGSFDMDSLHDLLEFSPALKDILGAKLDIKDGMRYREVVQKVSDLLPSIIREAGKEDAAKLEEYKNQIDRFFQGEKPETVVDQETVNRTIRDIGFADSVDKFAANEDYNAPMIAGVLERQSWGKILHNLKKGDKVVSFLVPGADFLSIKYLNDNVFGPQITNEIIAQKRLVLESKMQEIDKDAALLQSDYKTEIIRIPESADVSDKRLKDIAQAVDAEMTDFVLDTADRLLRHEHNPSKVDALKKFKNDLQGRNEKNKSGFRMNYGLATVDGDQMKDQLLALDHSLQTSRVAREDKKNYGAEYSEFKTLEEINHIKELRDEIVNAGNKITDLDGNEFNVFLPVPVEGSATRYTLDRDLLRDVRKGKFKTADKNLLDKIVLYVKRLNILDVVKPFIYAEAETVGKNIERSHQLAEKIKNQELSETERKEVVDILRADEKAPEYTSKTEFHKRATAMEDAVYVSMDVLDLGVDLLLEYESALQDIDNVPEDKKLDKFNEVSLYAGDQTTEKLRSFRSEVVRVYKEFGLGDGLVVGEVGGDELTLAIDMKDLMKGEDEGDREEKLNKLLFALKEATNTRVVKTVIAESEKHISNQSNERTKVEAHLKAMKRAEIGSGIAKDLEEVSRKLTRILDKKGEAETQEKIDGLNEIFVIQGKEVKADFVITENDGEFKISSSKGQFDYQKIRGEIDKILGKV